MKYDFTSIMDRKGKDSIAVEPGDMLGKFELAEGFDIIPMWVADMNFPTVPTITDALIERAKHPAFGYFDKSNPAYFNAIIKWHEDRNGVTGLAKEHIGYENSVLGGVSTALNVLCSKGDAVLLHSPTYIGFTKTLTNAGYKIVLSDLYLDENNVWRINYEDMEKKIVENKIHTAVFCSPHNPTGRVWEKEELEKVMEIYKKHDVYVISDEIWSDLILGDYKHIPTQSVSEDARNRTVAVYAPSKTFNLAGLIGAYHIVYNKWIRERMEKEKEEAYQKGYVTTIMNRRRKIDELKSSNYMVRSSGERMALNTPIQGSAADILKKAMVELYQAMQEKKLKSKILIQVHDELVIEAPDDEVETAKEILVNCMENVIKLKLPLKAEAQVGKNWYEAH